jgi:hypothetical protein
VIIRCACALTLLVFADGEAQQVRPWVGGTVGIGRLSVHGVAGGGISGEAVAGVTVPYNVHIGARIVHVNAVEIVSDEASWTGNTLLATIAWTPDSAITLSTGLGRATSEQADTHLRGHGAVVETGIELSVPRGRGPALRILLMRTWAVADPNWSDGARHGRTSQLHLGVGAVFR